MSSAPQADTVVGTEIADRYLIEAVLGRGGMSVVYRARDTLLGRTVAIKSFHQGLADVADLRRQSSEVQLLASLNHPALVTLFDAVAVEDDRISLVMEYVPGVDLGRELASGALLPQRAALIGLDLARALAYIHDRGVVHRDVKPANVLVPEQAAADGSAHARLADFGIARIVDAARLTSTGSVIGTAGYLSPEQALGRESGPAGDVYSLGLVVLECLTGVRAFPGSALEAAAARISRDPAIPESVPPAWRDLLSGMTAREPADRPTAREASERLAVLTMVDAGLLGDPDGGGEDVDTAMLLPSETITQAMTAPQTATADTKVFEADRSADAPTERFATPVDAEAAEAHGRPGGDARPGVRRPNRRTVAVLAIGAVVVIAAAVGTIAIQGAGEDPPAVDYPVVEGDLGTHLDQLQRSVDR